MLGNIVIMTSSMMSPHGKSRSLLQYRQFTFPRVFLCVVACLLFFTSLSAGISMAVQVEKWNAPFTDVTTSYLKLTNPTDQQICFKLKTTAPKTYCVRPNSGILPPHENVSVAVMLQPFNDVAESMKHKFMVQSLFAPDGEVKQDSLWREASADSLMNSKLKCVFDVEHPVGLQQQDGDSVDMLDATNEDIKSASDVTIEGNQNASPKATKIELRKAREENKRLMEALKELRMENASFKEEHLRWRRSKATPAFNPVESLRTQETSMGQDNSVLTLNNSIIGVVVLICGILLGMKLF